MGINFIVALSEKLVNKLLTKDYLCSNNWLMPKSAIQKGVVAPPLVIGGAVVVGLIVLLLATGNLNFTAKITKSGSEQTQSTSVKDKIKELAGSSVEMAAEPFSSSQFGFSISYPKDWKVRNETTGVTVYLPKAQDANQADALIVVSTASLGQLKGSKLSTIADLQKVQLKNQFSGMTVVKEGATKVGDVEAYEIEFTASVKAENMRTRYVILTSDTNLYGILGSAESNLWDKYKDHIDKSLSSFKLL